MGGRGGGSPGGTGDWRAAVDDSMIPVEIGNARFLVANEATWPRAHLLPNAVEQARLENQLREVVRSLASAPQAMVRLERVRDVLAKRGWNRTRQDAAIAGLAHRADARVTPIANLKSLKEGDWRAAIFLGGEFSHAIAVGF